MVREVENFIDIRQERVVDRLVQSGMYDEGLSTHLKANRYYFKFSVLDYLDTEAAAIFPQYGTFKSIENPVLATLFTDMQLIAAINFTEAKRDVIRFLLKNIPRFYTGSRKEMDRQRLENCSTGRSKYGNFSLSGRWPANGLLCPKRNSGNLQE